MPEAIYPLSQATIYLATAPKSNSTKAYFKAAAAVRDNPGAGVPIHLRNAANSVMADAGYGDGYIYDHEAPDSFSGQECLPEQLSGSTFYQPGQFGYEKDIAKRLEWWQKKLGFVYLTRSYAKNLLQLRSLTWRFAVIQINTV